MPEGFNYIPEIQDKQKRLDNQINLSFTDIKDNIRQNYEINSTIPGSDTLVLKQYQTLQETNSSKESKEIQIQQETKEKLDKEAMISEVRIMLYEKLGIDSNLENNNSIENFIKGIVDELILNNYYLAIQIWETNGKILIDSIKHLFTWEGLKQIAEGLKESIWDLFTGNAYEKGKAIAELGLITTGAGTGVYIGKKGLKLGMKEISRLRVNKERFVKSPELKQIISDTKNKIDEIVPKQEINFEKALVEDIAKLGDEQRLEAASFYLKKQLTKQEQEAILKAHNIGINRDGAGIYNYTQTEILKKIKILKEAGFSKEERRILLEKGVCGKEIDEDLIIKELGKKEKIGEEINFNNFFSFKKINDILDNDNIFDVTRGNTLKEGLTNKEFISYLEKNIELKKLLDKYKTEYGNVIDPDNFRTLFLEYDGLNSSKFDEIVGKLSKLYYRKELIELDKKSIHLIGGAPGSGKSTALKYNGAKTPENFGLVFDSTLNDIKFVDYLVNQAKLNGINNISISFIHRKPELAWEGVVKRAIKEKRPVNLSYFIDTYKKVINVVTTLEKRGYKLDIIDNSAGLNDIKQVDFSEFRKIVENNVNKEKLVFITNNLIDKEIYKQGISLDEVTLLEKLRKELNT